VGGKVAVVEVACSVGETRSSNCDLKAVEPDRVRLGRFWR
jgi:hypothetical protein